MCSNPWFVSNYDDILNLSLQDTTTNITTLPTSPADIYPTYAKSHRNITMISPIIIRGSRWFGIILWMIRFHPIRESSGWRWRRGRLRSWKLGVGWSSSRLWRMCIYTEVLCFWCVCIGYTCCREVVVCYLKRDEWFPISQQSQQCRTWCSAS